MVLRGADQSGVCCRWIASAIVESIIIFLACIFCLESPAATGESFSIFELGGIMFSVVITVVNIRVAIETHLHHWLYSIVIFLSIASWWLCSWLFSLMDANGTRGVTKHMFASSTSWFAMALATWLCVIRIVAWKMYKRHFRSRLRHVVQEAQLVTGDFDKLQAWQEKRRSRSGSTTDTTPPQQHQQKQKQQQQQPNPAAHWHSQAAGGGEQEAKPSSSSAARPRLSRTRSGLVRAASDYHLYHSGADFSHDDSHAEYHADRLSRHGSVSGYHIRRRAMTVLGSTRGLSVRFAPIVAGTLGKYRLILLLTCGCNRCSHCGKPWRQGETPVQALRLPATLACTARSAWKPRLGWGRWRKRQVRHRSEPAGPARA